MFGMFQPVHAGLVIGFDDGERFYSVTGLFDLVMSEPGLAECPTNEHTHRS
jgi:hypothetical protein